MVKSCCAVGCTNRYSKGCGLRFYRFPSNVDRRSRWLAAMKRENWKPNEHSWVCSAHFVSGNKSDDPLSPDYIPSVFSYVGSPDKRRAKRQLERYEQRKHSKRRRLEYAQKSDDAAEGMDVDPTANGVAQTHAVSTRDSTTMTDTPRPVSTTTMTDVTSRYIEALEDECIQSTSKLDKNSKPNPLSQDAFKDDDQKVNFYTGLPSFQILMVIFNFVSPHVKHGSSKTHALSKFEEFIATLMKLV